MRRFELSDGTSEKFWEVGVEGSSFTVRFGRIGTNGQTQTKTFPSDAKALAEADKLVGEKTKKGYVEVGSSAAAPAPVNPKKANPAPTASSKPASATPASPAPETAPAPAKVARAATDNASSGTGKAAAEGDLPRVLASPPWLSGKKRPAPTVVDVATLARPYAFAWKKGELEKYGFHYRPTKTESAAILADMVKRVKEHGERVSPYIDSWWCVIRMVDADVKTAWDTLPLVVWRANTALYVLARLDHGCLPKYVDYAVGLRQPTTSHALSRLVSPDVAVIMGDGFAGRRSRADAEEWLRAQPEMSAIGLFRSRLARASRARTRARRCASWWAKGTAR